MNIKLFSLLSVTVQDIVFQLQRFVAALSKYHNDCHGILKEADVFPIEVDLSRSTFSYDRSNEFNDNDEGQGEDGEEEEDDELCLASNENLISTD